MLAKMTKTTKGSPDGIKVVEYKAGGQYNLPESLYHIFKKIGVCQDVEVKAVKNAPENKMMQVPDNKVPEEVVEEKIEDIEETEEEKIEDKQSYKRRRR